MEWLQWFEQHKEAYAHIKYGRGYTLLTHPQIQVLQDEMADVWVKDWFTKNK